MTEILNEIAETVEEETEFEKEIDGVTIWNDGNAYYMTVCGIDYCLTDDADEKTAQKIRNMTREDLDTDLSFFGIYEILTLDYETHRKRYEIDPAFRNTEISEALEDFMDEFGIDDLNKIDQELKFVTKV